MNFLILFLLVCQIFSSMHSNVMAVEPPTKSVTFVASQALFTNPERGWIVHRFSHDMWGIADLRNSPEKISLVLVKIDLSAYVQSSHIGQAKLDEIRRALSSCRTNGIKVILRSAYSWDELLAPEPKNIETVKNHIMDMKSIYYEYEDVILAAEMGMFGPWGEMHSSYYSTVNTQFYYPVAKNALKQIHATYMLALPTRLSVLVRTPNYIRQIFDDNNPLSTEEFNQGSPKSRTGYHNDAYLYGPDDSGTFAYGWSRSQELTYINQMTRYNIFGGETFGTPNGTYNNANNALLESKMQHMTYLHRDYSKAIYNAWGVSVKEEFTRKLGYRFELLNLTYSEQIAPGGSFYFRLNLRNTGFAPMYLKRPVNLILDNGKTGSERIRYETSLTVDIRTWTPETNSVTIERRIRIPVSIKEGLWSLFLAIPDEHSQLKKDDRFAVRFAHDNMWNNDGSNVLVRGIVITTSAPGSHTKDDKFEEISSSNSGTTISNTIQPTAVKSASFFTFSAIFDQSYSFYQVLIDSDSNSRTGYLFQGIGADLLIENNYYYKHQGTTQNNWSWQTINITTKAEINGHQVTWRIPSTELNMSIMTKSSRIIFIGTEGNKVNYSSTIFMSGL